MLCTRFRHRSRLALASLLLLISSVGWVVGCGAPAPEERATGHAQDALSGKASKVRICHFEGKKHSAKIIEVSENALTAHLNHGDGLAPPSVRTDADCLVPQAPDSSVTLGLVSSTTGPTRSTIPDTNIVASVSVRDGGGNLVGGVDVTLLVQGHEYVAIANDPDLRYGSTVAVGRLSEARPGSALTLAIVLVLEACNLIENIKDISDLISSAGNNSLLTSQFVNGALVIDECFTKDEFEQRIEGLCDLGAIASGLAIGSSSGGVPGALAGCVGGLYFCPAVASFFGSSFFPDGAGAQRVRFTWGGPIPWIERVGSCGGACCDLANDHCTDVSRATSCLSYQGDYLDGELCSADPCAPGDANLDTSAVQTADPVELGEPATFQFRVANGGPEAARNVVATITFPPELTPAGAVHSVSNEGVSRACTTSPGGVFTCNLGTLAPYEVSATVPIVATIEGSATTTEPGHFAATMVVTTTTNDPDADNNAAMADWTVQCPDGTTWNEASLECENAPCPWETPKRNSDSGGCEACPATLPVWNRSLERCTAPNLSFSCTKYADYAAISLTGNVNPAECREQELYADRFCRPIEYEGGYFDEHLCYAGVSYTIYAQRETMVDERSVAGYNDVGGSWGHWYGVFGLSYWDTRLLYYWDPWTPVYGSDPVRRVRVSVTVDGCYSLVSDWIDCEP